MTTPLFRKGHLYAVRARGETAIATYLGAENGFYWFKTARTNNVFGVEKDFTFIIHYIGNNNTKIVI